MKKLYFKLYNLEYKNYISKYII